MDFTKVIKLKDLIKEEDCECGGGCCSTKEQVNEAVEVETSIPFELRGFGGNDLYIKGKKINITLSFKGSDLEKAVKAGKGKGKVVMASVKI